MLKFIHLQKILEEYAAFTDSIIDFDIIKFDNKPYLVVIGTDLKSKEDKSEAKAEIKTNKEIR